MERIRTILEDQGLYIGITNQQLVRNGSRGEEIWTDAGGGGDFFDPTEKQKEILKKHGSPVIVYPDGRIEETEEAKEKLVNDAKRELSNLEMELIQIGPNMTSEEIQKVVKKREELQNFVSGK